MLQEIFPNRSRPLRFRFNISLPFMSPGQPCYPANERRLKTFEDAWQIGHPDIVGIDRIRLLQLTQIARLLDVHYLLCLS